MFDHFKARLIKVLNFLIKKGVLLFDEKSIQTGQECQIVYQSSYNKVINPHRVKIHYFKYLDETYRFSNSSYFVKHCFIEKDSGGVIKNHKVIKNTFLNCWGYVFKSGIYKYLLYSRFRLRKNNTVNKGFLLTGNMSDNFFHFLIDSLPRIFDYLELKKIHHDLQLIINHKKPFSEQYLYLLGIPEDDIVWIRKNIWVEELFYSNNKFVQSNPKNTWPNFIYSPNHLKQMAQICLESALKLHKQSNFPEKIYISRAKVGTRVLLNEKDFVQILKVFNIERIFLEEFTVVEQIILMSKAKVIVAVHGAGLSNLIYVKHALVIEFFPYNKKLSTVYQMHQLGQIGSNRHVLYVLEQVTENQDFILELDDFEELLTNELTIKVE